MIRRTVDLDCRLITQADLARLAARLAGQVGGAFAPPEPLAGTVAALALHACGWADDDARPTLNPQGLPRDDTEHSRPELLNIWQSSAARAERDGGPYAGLLVCLHLLARSAALLQPPERGVPIERPGRLRFEINRFQNVVVERLERLRGLLGLATDRPLRLGLGDGWTTPDEERLKYNLRLLQVMTQIARAVCGQSPPPPHSGLLHRRPGDTPVNLRLDRRRADRLLIFPWPFVPQQIEESVPYRAIHRLPFMSETDLQTAYATAPTGAFQILFTAG